MDKMISMRARFAAWVRRTFGWKDGGLVMPATQEEAFADAAKDWPVSGYPEVSPNPLLKAAMEQPLSNWPFDTDMNVPKRAKAQADYAMVVQVDLWLAWRDAQIKKVEGLRREKHDPALNPRPIPNIVDYAAAAQAITLALQATDESIPNGQRERTEAAVVLMEEGLKHLKTWLEVRGYSVSGLKRDPAWQPTFYGLVTDPLDEAIVRNGGKFTL